MVSSWADLRVRVWSGAVMIPLGVLTIWAGGTVWLSALAILGFGVAFEWVRLCRAHIITAGTGILYVSVACAALAALRQGPSGFGNVLFVMVVVWAGDIGAYVAGRSIGGPRLWPALSPSKTWAGALGGLAASAAMGAAVAWMLGPVHGALIVAVFLGAVAQAGDLLESKIKRLTGAKDSGALIPGHGGLLDRLDGVLAAGPAACGLWMVGHKGAYLWT